MVTLEQLDQLMQLAGDKREFMIDLPNQSIQVGDLFINFDLENDRKERLLQGLDDIGITLGYQSDIAAYEQDQKNKKPWLFQDL